MRGGGKKWLEIGEDMAFGRVLGLPMYFFSVFVALKRVFCVFLALRYMF